MPNVDRGAGRPRRGAVTGAPGASVPGRPRGRRAASLKAAVLLLALGTGLGLWGAASAEAAVLVLGVHTEQQLLPRARAQVAQHLSRMGETTRDPSLSSGELLCTERECLERLARAHRAERLVGGEILPNDRNYLVRMWLYDAVAQQPTSGEDRCIECTAEQAYELAARVTGRLLDAAAVAAATAATPPGQAAAATAPGPTPAAPPESPPTPPQAATATAPTQTRRLVSVCRTPK